MNVNAETTIKLTINDQVWQLTRSEAQQIYNALGMALGTTVGQRGVFDWPLTMPNTVPCSTPIWKNDVRYGNNFDVTCEAK